MHPDYTSLGDTQITLRWVPVVQMNENNVKDSTDTIQPPQINRMKEEIVVYTHCTQGLWGNAIPLGRNQKL